MFTQRKTQVRFVLLITLGIALFSFPLQPAAQSSAQSEDYASVIRWSPSGDRIAIGYTSGRIEIWDVATEQLLYELIGHKIDVWTLAWDPDGTRLLSGGSDLTLRMWDITTGEELMSLSNYPADISAVDWSKDGSRFVVITTDGYMEINDGSTGDRFLYKLIEAGIPFIMDWSPDGSMVAVGEHTGQIEIVDGKTLEHIAFMGELPIERATVSILEVAWSPDSTLVAGGTWDGFIYVWDVSAGYSLLEDLPTSDVAGVDLDMSLVKAISFTPDGAILQSVSKDGTLRRWNASTGEILESVELDETIFAAVFSPDGEQLAYATTADEPPTFILISQLDTP